MSNETIRTFTEITPLDGLKMLVENKGKQIDGLAFKDTRGWVVSCLSTTLTDHEPPHPFRSSSGAWWMRCAKVTEIDPCKAPDGCPELEPWMAYVGKGALSPIIPPSAALENGENPYFCAHKGDEHFYETDGSFDTCHHFIDVRTEWAKEHFPEHCRIRNYQEVSIEDCRAEARLFKDRIGHVKWVAIFKEMLNGASCLSHYKGSYADLVEKMRNYPTPDAFEEWLRRNKFVSIVGGAKILLREAYELGQANPKKEDK